jgi:hypothetical protein
MAATFTVTSTARGCATASDDSAMSAEEYIDVNDRQVLLRMRQRASRSRSGWKSRAADPRRFMS